MGTAAVRGLLAGWLGLLLLLATPAWAQDVLPVPALTGRVIDTTGTLPAERRQALEARLAAFEAQAGPQIVVLMVASTLPEDIASYAQRVGETWKLGRKDVGDGLLLVVAKEDRRIWIATSKAVEGAVPDLAARQIIRDSISPAFKRGDFAGGLEAGVDRLMARLKGEGLPAPRSSTPADAVLGDWADHLQDVALFFFVAIPVISLVLTSVFGRRLGGLLTSGAAGGIGWWITGSVGLAIAAGIAAFVVVGILGIGALLRNAGGAVRAGRGGRGSGPIVWGGGTGGFGGGTSGGGGGGGFSSGGGGDFGGGGAGGDW